MIAASAHLKIYIATRPIDFRCGHDGLAANVQEMLRLDPFSGAAFVFHRNERTGSRFWSGIERAWCQCTSVSKVASSFEIEIEADTDQVLELAAQLGVVSHRVLADPVQGKAKRTNLSVGAVCPAHDSDFVMVEFDQGAEHRMTVDQSIGRCIQRQRHGLAEAA